MEPERPRANSQRLIVRICYTRNRDSEIGLKAKKSGYFLKAADSRRSDNQEDLVRIGASLVLIALGAILKFAVTKHVNGIDLGTVGIVLMVVGIVGLLITLVMMSMRRRTDVVYRQNGSTVVEPPLVDPRY
jgi:hypothetical protein